MRCAEATAKQPELAGLDQRQGNAEIVEHEVDIAGEQPCSAGADPR